MNHILAIPRTDTRRLYIIDEGGVRLAVITGITIGLSDKGSEFAGGAATFCIIRDGCHALAKYAMGEFDVEAKA